MKHSRHTLHLAAVAAFAASASPLLAGSRIAPHTPHSTKLTTVHATVPTRIAQMPPIMPHNPPVTLVPTAPIRLQPASVGIPIPLIPGLVVAMSPIAPHNPPVGRPMPTLPATRVPVVAMSPIAPHNPPVKPLPIAVSAQVLSAARN